MSERSSGPLNIILNIIVVYFVGLLFFDGALFLNNFFDVEIAETALLAVYFIFNYTPFSRYLRLNEFWDISYQIYVTKNTNCYGIWICWLLYYLVNVPVYSCLPYFDVVSLLSVIFQMVIQRLSKKRIINILVEIPNKSLLTIQVEEGFKMKNLKDVIETKSGIKASEQKIIFSKNFLSNQSNNNAITEDVYLKLFFPLFGGLPGDCDSKTSDSKSDGDKRSEDSDGNENKGKKVNRVILLVYTQYQITIMTLYELEEVVALYNTPNHKFKPGLIEFVFKEIEYRKKGYQQGKRGKFYENIGPENDSDEKLKGRRTYEHSSCAGPSSSRKKSIGSVLPVGEGDEVQIKRKNAHSLRDNGQSSTSTKASQHTSHPATLNDSFNLKELDTSLVEEEIASPSSTEIQTVSGTKPPKISSIFEKTTTVSFRRSNGTSTLGIAHGVGTYPNEIFVHYKEGKKSIPLATLAETNADFKQFLPLSQELSISSQSSLQDLVNELPSTNKPEFERKKLDGNYVYNENEFHYLSDNLGKKKLIILTNVIKDTCFAFGPDGKRSEGKWMKCHGCHNKGHHCRAFLSEDKKVVYMQDKHQCVEKNYTEEMNSLLDPHLITGKTFDIEKYGLNKYLEGEFEISNFIDGNQIKKKLIVFVDSSKELCYEFSWNENKYFKCVGCDSAKPRRNLGGWVKHDDEGSIAYTKVGHTCRPKKYTTVKLQKSKSKELIAPDGFEIVNYLNGRSDVKKNLIVKDKADDSKCFVYSVSAKDLYACIGCRGLKSTLAKVIGLDGSLYLMADIEHVCAARNYDQTIEKLKKNEMESIDKCEFKEVIMKNGRQTTHIHIYVDKEKNIGYKFGVNNLKLNVYNCLGCQRKNIYTLLYVNKKDENIFSIIRNREHACDPELLKLRELPTLPIIRRIEWPKISEGEEALKWLELIFSKFGRGSTAMCACYFLSTSPPTADPDVIVSNKFYDGFSSEWMQRAYSHFSRGKWDNLLKIYGQIWLYPILIDESSICEEMEALGIALSLSGSIDLLSQNVRREKFKLYDNDRQVYVLEEIATSKSHPDHAKLLLAYKTYLIKAASSESLKQNAINLELADPFGSNPIQEPLAYWK